MGLCVLASTKHHHQNCREKAGATGIRSVVYAGGGPREKWSLSGASLACGPQAAFNLALPRSGSMHEQKKPQSLGVQAARAFTFDFLSRSDNGLVAKNDVDKMNGHWAGRDGLHALAA